MKFAIKGASGFIGKHLTKYLKEKGHSVTPLPRVLGSCELLENLDGLINLSGENIASGRWSRKKKKALYTSRINETKNLINLLKEVKNPPKVLLNASATGYYGESTKEAKEDFPPGKDFLASLCEAWEKTALLYPKGRVVIARFGVVIGKEGGALKKMSPIFRMGLGGSIGSGMQKMSWISLEDLLEALYFLLLKEVSGPFNLCAPKSITNKELTEALGKALSCPVRFSIPAFVIKVLFGEMGKATLLSSSSALPTRLLEEGFTFSHETIEKALYGAL